MKGKQLKIGNDLTRDELHIYEGRSFNRHPRKKY